MKQEESVSAATTFRLLLVRHGETVDNVKGLYAGVRDSALTSHGVQQAQRLGQYIAKQGTRITYLFSSDLSRAVKTADAIRAAQEKPEKLSLVQLECLREQDFGFFEGKPFYVRAQDSKSGKEAQRERNKDVSGFQDLESHESMNRRCMLFWEQQLQPILKTATSDKPCTIVIVSHGMLLSALWKSLLRQQPPNSVTTSPELSSSAYPRSSIEHIGGWSNTGYLELTLTCKNTFGANECNRDREESFTYSLHVNGANRKDHLSGLKRTRGGVGSAQHDESQRSIEAFFKKVKIR